MQEDRYTYDEIAQLVRESNLGTTLNADNISGMLCSFIDGAHQALFNIVKKPDALAHGLLHLSDPTHGDVWMEGHNAVLRQYHSLTSTIS